MAIPSERLLADLQARLGPKGFTRDPMIIEPWLTDWRGRYRGASAALLSPCNTEEVQAIVELCAANGTALVPQGGNSSMVGGATPDASGAALLVSLRRMNRIRSTDLCGNLIIAEAGTTLSAVHEAAAALGRRFPLSLAAKGSATIGGLVSTNAGGTQVLRHGTMRALVAGLEAVLATGDRYDGLSALKKDNRGYDISGLLIGAEGTLGVVTAAALRLAPAVAERAVAWAGLNGAEEGLMLLRLLEISRLSIESFELLPASALELVLAHIPGSRSPLVGHHAWHLLIEAVGDVDPGEPLGEGLARAKAQGLIEDAAIASSEAQADTFWRLRDSISEAERIDGPAAKHDISVPVASMPRFIVEVAAEVEARFPGSRVIAFGHLGDGNIHFNVRAPRGEGSDAWLARGGNEVTRFVHDAAIAAGGSISADHGVGQMKLAELARTGDPVRMTAQRAIKRALDPDNIMNPGKLVPLASQGAGT